MRRLAALCGSLPVHVRDLDAFTNDVMSCMVDVFVASGDRDSLVILMLTRCPLRVGSYLDIEFYLASHPKKLKDPILILFEAYLKCQVPQVRRNIAGAVRRAFTDSGVTGRDDNEFVTNAMRWYEQKKDHLTVNMEYYFSATASSAQAYEEFPKKHERPVRLSKEKPVPLFLPTGANK